LSGIRAARGAFTLMEMVIAMAAFMMLMVSIYGISQATINLTDDLSMTQERSLLRQNFIDFLRRSFRNLPGDAEVRLSVKQQGGSYVATLNVVNGGTSFTPGGALPPDTSAEMFAEERPGGYMRVSLRTLDDRQTRSMRSGQTVRYSRDQPIITLLDNVSRFEWRFYDTATKRWENNWKSGKRPLLAEMNLELDDGFQARVIFWVPPVLPGGVVGGAGVGTGLGPGGGAGAGDGTGAGAGDGTGDVGNPGTGGGPVPEKP
jgi:type II secretion system protein J